MALLFMDGFDAGDYTQKYTYLGGSASSNTTTRFSTGRSLNLAGTYRKVIPARVTLFVGMAWYWTFTDGTDRMVIGFAGDNAATSHITVAQNSGRIVARRGGTLLGTSAAVLSPSTWHYIEIKVVIDPTAGNVTVRYLGNDIVSFTGNTKNGGTNTSLDAVDISATSGATFLFDDFYINDDTGGSPYNTFLGDVRVHTMSPSGAGASTGFTPSSGANYTTVDELPYSATDYVSSNTPSTRDTYVMADLPAAASTIFGVQTNVVAKKTDAGSIAVKPVIRSGGTNYYGSSAPLTGSDITVSDLRTVDPNTSAAWTAGGVNGMEAGVEVA